MEIGGFVGHYINLITNYLVMGRTKETAQSDLFFEQGFSTVSGKKSRKNSQFTAPAPVEDAEAMASLREIGLQLWHRLCAKWYALQYQFHIRTFGVFKNKKWLKIAVLSGLAYVAFNTELLVKVKSPIGAIFTKRDHPAGEMRFEIGGGSSEFGKNGAAPVGVSDLADEQARDYIQRYGKIAQAEMERYGIPASISLAQGLVESRAGMSTLAKRNNNHFGMKCFSKKCRKGHCSNFTDDHHKDFFRIFSNPWESWREHSQMLASGRYASLKKFGKDYRQWSYGLKNLGYATDKTYAEKLIGVIEKYQLHQFDR